MFETLDRSSMAQHGDSSPEEVVVCKDGKPFAILNATPALVRRTLAGFAQAEPSASWSIERT